MRIPSGFFQPFGVGKFSQPEKVVEQSDKFAYSKFKIIITAWTL